MSLDNLPVGWGYCQLGQVLTLVNGRAYKKHEMLDKGTPILRIQNLNGGNNWFYSDLNLPDDKYCEKDDLLYAWSATFGPYWSKWDKKVIYHYHIWKVIPSAYMLKKFAYYELLRITDSLKASAHGVAMPHITKEGMEKWSILFPPLAEQQEIVRQLDIMLAQVEQIKARLDAIPAILKKFRQSVLADAVSGKLTEEWRKSNPHTISIETIESCRLNKWWLEKQKYLLSKGKKVTEKDKAKYKPAYLPESNFYGAIPPEWSLCTIDHLFDVTKLAGFEFTKFVKYHDDYDIPVIKAENVGKNGFKETQFSKVEKTVVDALPRSSIFGNELLIVFVGAGTGQVGRVPSNRRYFLGPNVALVKPNLCDLINSEFFEYLLRSLSGQDSLLSFAKGAAQPSLSMDQIRHATIVVPPIEEQEVILASIKILFNKASQIESLVNIAQKRVNLLTQSILAKAFSGELTAEWREQHQDLITGVNSAEALLAKIQAEREASKPVKKAKKVK
ncbi:restriction endonuclease subunit S [Acinetobacter indicus]|uniref:restriction endonuclease subunit S n=1 Tax=Acinetobacter indicus TaxID=756892 RepID=UPI0025777695|nr:restriction endonuclease subunit S [Acinetobacter indicus]MDM1274644.1 restriction endonuclease subunit S [Acinetobacter indicus]MDM1300343.1 restriction endonuclease subunit S [Acinetobacter indicus]